MAPLSSSYHKRYKRYKNFIHSPMWGKGKRSGVADRSMASPTYNTNMSIWLSDY